jgi:hypothetical protein
VEIIRTAASKQWIVGSRVGTAGAQLTLIICGFFFVLFFNFRKDDAGLGRNGGALLVECARRKSPLTNFSQPRGSVWGSQWLENQDLLKRQKGELSDR